MRLVLHGDVTAVARVLMSVTDDRRNLLCSSILSQAHSADCYRKRFNRPHPDWESAALWPWRAVWACKPNLNLQILNIATVSKGFFLGCVIGERPSLTGRATQAKLYRWIERKSIGGNVIATVVTSTKGVIIKSLTGVQQCTALRVTPGLCWLCHGLRLQGVHPA